MINDKVDEVIEKIFLENMKAIKNPINKNDIKTFNMQEHLH